MSIQANENGTLKDISASNTGTFQINGIDYLGDYSANISNDKITVSLPKTLGNYRFILILITDDGPVTSGRTSGSGNLIVVSVPKLLRNVPETSSSYITYVLSCTLGYSSGATYKTFYISNVQTLTEDSTSFEITPAATRFIHEVYGIF